ncbi:MAG TPA: FtsQ-type POTRA domain-containing protein [Eggerthellaceae bacterium]|nr:FtsQ-type POTRA domain-containing protein [Eggerthellaceae bacterium]
MRRSSSATSPRTRTASSSYSARSQRSSARSRNQSEQPLRSVSVSDVHNAARYRSKRAARRLPIVVIVGVILVAVLGIAGVVLANSGVFTVRQVTVSGVSHITAEEMTELAAVPEGTTLLNVDANGITSRLTSNPWVQSASVDRVFPDTLNLNVTERTISAVVSVTVDESNTVERWALASDGMWLTELPDQNSAEGQALPASVYEDAANALEITDIPYGSSPEAGKYCNNANVENALSIIDGMTTELADQIKSVSAASSNSTTLTLDNGVEIAFGDSQDIRDKERVCLELLQEHEGKISYINVRVVNKPVWRSL